MIKNIPFLSFLFICFFSNQIYAMSIDDKKAIYNEITWKIENIKADRINNSINIAKLNEVYVQITMLANHITGALNFYKTHWPEGYSALISIFYKLRDFRKYILNLYVVFLTS